MSTHVSTCMHPLCYTYVGICSLTICRIHRCVHSQVNCCIMCHSTTILLFLDYSLGRTFFCSTAVQSRVGNPVKGGDCAQPLQSKKSYLTCICPGVWPVIARPVNSRVSSSSLHPSRPSVNTGPVFIWVSPSSLSPCRPSVNTGPVYSWVSSSSLCPCRLSVYTGPVYSWVRVNNHCFDWFAFQLPSAQPAYRLLVYLGESDRYKNRYEKHYTKIFSHSGKQPQQVANHYLSEDKTVHCAYKCAEVDHDYWAHEAYLKQSEKLFLFLFFL